MRAPSEQCGRRSVEFVDGPRKAHIQSGAPLYRNAVEIYLDPIAVNELLTVDRDSACFPNAIAKAK